jgi:predicted RNase H-like nuclease (RuvC/YqgF family)
VVVVLSKIEANIDTTNRVNTEFSPKEVEDLSYLASRRQQIQTKVEALQATPEEYWKELDRLDKEVSFIESKEKEIFVEERGRRICRKLTSRYLSVRKFLAISARDYLKFVSGY